jgi:hypothetical protein
LGIDWEIYHISDLIIVLDWLEKKFFLTPDLTFEFLLMISKLLKLNAKFKNGINAIKKHQFSVPNPSVSKSKKSHHPNLHKPLLPPPETEKEKHYPSSKVHPREKSHLNHNRGKSHQILICK